MVSQRTSKTPVSVQFLLKDFFLGVCLGVPCPVSSCWANQEDTFLVTHIRARKVDRVRIYRKNVLEHNY